MKSTGTPADTSLSGLDTDSIEMILDTVKDLRKRILTKDKILEFDKNDFFPESEIRKMLGPEIGLQLVFIPEAYGGIGGGDACFSTSECGG